jgi:hypothetical protein
MEDQECRIILRRCPDDQTEVSTFFCGPRREVRTGLVVRNSMLEDTIRKLKETLERGKHRVWVKGYI